MSDEPKTPDSAPPLQNPQPLIIPLEGRISCTMTVSPGPVARVFSPPPADHPIYNLVGRVASEMAHLEHILDLTIADLAQTDSEIIACVTASMLSPYARFQAIQSLALKRGASGAIIEDIEQEANKTSNVAKRRNRVVHDAWFVDQDNITAQAKSPQPKDARYGIYEVHASDLEKLIAEIQRRQTKIAAMRAEFSKLLPSSQ